MEQVWILELGEANNLSYDRTYLVYDSYEKASEAKLDYFIDRLKECGYDEQAICEIISDPEIDGNGNEVLNDPENEFYAKVIEAKKP